MISIARQAYLVTGDNTSLLSIERPWVHAVAPYDATALFNRPDGACQRVVATYWSDDNSNTRTRRPQVGLTVSRTRCIPSLVVIRSEASLPT